MKVPLQGFLSPEFVNGREDIRFEHYDFRGIKATEGIFGIHPYPAMLHFALVESILKEFLAEKKKAVLYDPFCGSGVSVSVAVRMGKTALGTDINPLALLIAEVRNMTDIRVEREIERIKKLWNNLMPDIPCVKNMEYWFKPENIEELGKLRTFIREHEDRKIRTFLAVVFAWTVREVSLTRKGEFKRFRIPESEIKNFRKSALDIFTKTAIDWQSRLNTAQRPSGKSILILSDARQKLPIKENSVDMVITSPPYGDSRTTVAYGEYSSFAIDWLNGIFPFPKYDIDKVSIGGKGNNHRSGKGKKRNDDLPHLPSNVLDEVIENVEKKNPKRAYEVHKFFSDLFLSQKNIVEVLKEGALICFVVGNRKVCGVNIPTSVIVKDFFENLGLKHIETRRRRIFNKRMPEKNSPKNIKGKKDETIKWEYIVIMRK